METVYFHYGADESSGEISIMVTRTESDLRENDYYGFSQKNRMKLDKNPDELINELEMMIIDNNEESPNTKCLRSISYLPSATIIREEEKGYEAKKRRIDEENSARHGKIYRTYLKFLKKWSSESLGLKK